MTIEIKKNNNYKTWLEGDAPKRPTFSEVKEQAKKIGWFAYNIEIWFDQINKHWMFTGEVRESKMI